jgi:hypothetical protein
VAARTMTRNHILPQKCCKTSAFTFLFIYAYFTFKLHNHPLLAVALTWQSAVVFLSRDACQSRVSSTPAAAMWPSMVAHTTRLGGGSSTRPLERANASNSSRTTWVRITSKVVSEMYVADSEGRRKPGGSRWELKPGLMEGKRRQFLVNDLQKM